MSARAFSPQAAVTTLEPVVEPAEAPDRSPAALDTFPKRLVHNAERFGERVAFREKEFGIWKEITWRQYLEEQPPAFGDALK